MTDQEIIDFAIFQKSQGKRKYMHAIMPIVEKMLGQGFSVISITDYFNNKGFYTTSKSIYLNLYKSGKSVAKLGPVYDIPILISKKTKDKKEENKNPESLYQKFTELQKKNAQKREEEKKNSL